MITNKKWTPDFIENKSLWHLLLTSLFCLLLASACEEPNSSPIVHTVTFDGNGGIPTPAPQRVNRSDTVVVPEAMNRQNYNFRGWYSDKKLTEVYDFSSPVLLDITLYAKWVHKGANICTITFNSAEEIPMPEPKIVNRGDIVETLPQVKRTGYLFAGWYMNKKLTKKYYFSVPVKTDIVLYASWISFKFLATENPEMALENEDKEDLLASSFDVYSDVITVDASAYIHIDKLKKAQYTNHNAQRMVVTFADLVISSPLQQEKDTIAYVLIPQGSFSHRVIIRYSNLAVIPDENFKNRLNPNWMKGDLLQIQRVKTQVVRMDLNGSAGKFGSNKINSIKGIEFFTALKTLKVENNLLSKANFIDNNLDSLNIAYNRLTALILPSSLKVLYCRGSHILSLELSACPQLKVLSCENNHLSALNFSVNTELTSLDCSNNNLTTLNLAVQTKLVELNCSSNRITQLDIRGVRTIDSNHTFLLGISTGPNPGQQNLVAQLKANVAIKDATEIADAKRRRQANIVIVIYNDAGNQVYSDYTPI